jgi:hypothetical protein
MVRVVTHGRHEIPKFAAALFLLSVGALAKPAPYTGATRTRYLTFQIFTAGPSVDYKSNFPPPPTDLSNTVLGIKTRLGSPGSGDQRRAGFFVGPLALGSSDAAVRDLIRESFDIALKTDMAVGFHIDDSMFWRGMDTLNAPENLEWIDWNRTPSTGRRLDWSAKPTKIAPQLCFNSSAVKKAVSARATLIGTEIARGMTALGAAGKRELFAGVIAGSETGLANDYDTGRPVGYCALTNKGYSAAHPPADFNRARAEISREFIGFWAQALEAAGVPEDKVYSHVAFKPKSMSEIVPPDTAFADGVFPGFSTYPMPGHLEEIAREIDKHGNPPWASSEGTAVDPLAAGLGGQGVSMETYLGNLFNHGAQLVNIFGWGVGGPDNPFRKIAEAGDSIEAYRKFLNGEALKEAPYTTESSRVALADKVHRIQATLPSYVKAHGPAAAEPLMRALDEHLKKHEFQAAERTADQILQLLNIER